MAIPTTNQIFMNKPDGFYSEECKEDIILEPEDLTEEEWKLVCRLFCQDEHVVRIALVKPRIDWFIDSMEVLEFNTEGYK